MRIRLLSDGHKFSGNPYEIVTQMAKRAVGFMPDIGSETNLNLDQYLQNVIGRLQKEGSSKSRLNIEGATLVMKCHNFVESLLREGMAERISDYVPEYLNFLREESQTTKIADLIEAIKKASVLGWNGSKETGQHFSEVATLDILEKLYTLVPTARLVNSNQDILKLLDDRNSRETRI